MGQHSQQRRLDSVGLLRSGESLADVSEATGVRQATLSKWLEESDPIRLSAAREDNNHGEAPTEVEPSRQETAAEPEAREVEVEASDPDAMIRWRKPNGTEITTNATAASIEYAGTAGWAPI